MGTQGEVASTNTYSINIEDHVQENKYHSIQGNKLFAETFHFRRNIFSLVTVLSEPKLISKVAEGRCPDPVI